MKFLRKLLAAPLWGGYANLARHLWERLLNKLSYYWTDILVTLGTAALVVLLGLLVMGAFGLGGK